MNKSTVEKPPCASWKVWLGREIEGTVDRDAFTLFIRELPDMDKPDISYAFLGRNKDIKRVWLCKEFILKCADLKRWDLARTIIGMFPKAAIETTPDCISLIPKDVRNKVTLYIKVPVVLRPGDQICVGEPFADEAFEIGKGIKVNPELYKNDIKVL